MLANTYEQGEVYDNWTIEHDLSKSEIYHSTKNYGAYKRGEGAQSLVI